MPPPTLSDAQVVEFYRELLAVRAGVVERPPRERFAAVAEAHGAWRGEAALFDAEGEEVLFFVTRLKLLTDCVYDFAGCVAAMGGRPMGLYGYNDLMSSLLYRYALEEEAAPLLALLERMSGFLAHCLAFPFVPPPLVDCKNCVLCLMETGHSLQEASTRLSGKCCCHVFETHGDFTSVPEFTEADFGHVEGGEGGEAPPLLVPNERRNERMLLGTEVPEEPTGANPGDELGNFTHALADLKRQTDLRKKLVLLRTNLRLLNQSVVDRDTFLAPKNVSYFAVVFLRHMELGVRLKEDRRAAFSAAPPVEVDEAQVSRLKNKLMGSLDPNSKSHILNLFYFSALPFVYKYQRSYSLQASRLVWFKHMETLGYSCATIDNFVKYLHAAPLERYLGVELAQLRPPAGLDRRLYALFWVAVNVYAFGTSWSFVAHRQGDDPRLEARLPRGVYLFNGAVGFSHTFEAGVVRHIGPHHELFRTLSCYDLLLTQL